MLLLLMSYESTMLRKNLVKKINLCQSKQHLLLLLFS